MRSTAGGLTVAHGDMDAVGLDEVRPMVMLDPPAHTASAAWSPVPSPALPVVADAG